ncbi:MAG: DUF4142 domain-containing protein [Fulvivirga sp.]
MKTKNLTLSMLSILFTTFTINGLAQESTSLSDAQVAHVAVVANQIDIEYARIATKKSKNDEILNFAQTMIDDHTAVIEQASALVKKLKVTPQDNAVSQQLLKDAEKKKIELNKQSRKNFDKAYVDNEVAYHKAVIDAIEKLLIPETNNSELKGLLEAVLPALKTHLNHAISVQKQIGG